MTTTTHAPRRTGPLADRQWLLIGAACVVAILGVAALVAVAVQLNRSDAHEVSGPLGGRHAARFETASGADTLAVHVADLGDRLYVISTPGQNAPVPHVTDQDGNVRLQLAGGGGPARVDVRLSSRVRWALRIGVGLSHVSVDLSAGSVSSVEFAAGVGTADLRLPVPSGTVPVRVGAGAGQLTVHLPAGVAAAVSVRAGVGSMTLDGTTRSGVPAGGTYPLGGYADARDRYDLDLATGVSTLVIARN